MTIISNKKTPLCKLAYKYKTDKCPQIRHLYTLAYHKILKDNRKSIKKVLEMGIGAKKTMPHVKNYKVGASLYMWRDFFPNAQIYGADSYHSTMFEDERIKTFLCNEREKEELESLIKNTGSDIDLFIDDGSHRQEDQVFMCRTLMPLLDRGVMYIIEDIVDEQAIVEALPEYDCEIINIYSKLKKENIKDNEVLIVVRHKNI